MTDADLLPKPSIEVGAFWRSQLERTAHTHARVKGLPLSGSIRLVSARTEALDRIAGRRWLATGDAAISIDPLSSGGICQALKSGLVAARAVDGWLKGDRTALEEMSDWMREGFSRYQQLHTVYYGHERRWPDSLFWRRRQLRNDVQARVLEAALAN